MFNALKEDNDATIDDLVSKLRTSIERVQQTLKVLQNNGFIKRVVSDENGHYKILKDL